MKKSTWRQCGSKKRYRDEHEVGLRKKMCERERGIKLDYYWCGNCKGYHLTSREAIIEFTYFFQESV